MAKIQTEISVSKCDIIQAVLTEPLEHGQWIFPRDNDATVNGGANADCNVCAVGAVLRERLNPKASAYVYGIACSQIANTNPWMLKLSNYFERQAVIYSEGSRPSEHTRYRVAEFVAKEFPDTVLIDLATAPGTSLPESE